jgi:hypothetical protein
MKPFATFHSTKASCSVKPVEDRLGSSPRLRFGLAQVRPSNEDKGKVDASSDESGPERPLYPRSVNYAGSRLPTNVMLGQACARTRTRMINHAHEPPPARPVASRRR